MCEGVSVEMDAIGALCGLVGALPAGRMYRLKPLVCDMCMNNLRIEQDEQDETAKIEVHQQE